jgi:hypothetical protein
MASMEAAGMTEPLWSATVPLIDPSTVWAIIGRAAKKRTVKSTKTPFSDMAYLLIVDSPTLR